MKQSRHKGCLTFLPCSRGSHPPRTDIVRLSTARYYKRCIHKLSCLVLLISLLLLFSLSRCVKTSRDPKSCNSQSFGVVYSSIRCRLRSHTSQQEANIVRFPVENRSKENELKELAHRLELLRGQCKTHGEDEAVAEAANSTSLEVTNYRGGTCCTSRGSKD